MTVRSSSEPIAAPEPDLTPDELVARAVALRPKLIAAQADTEERTYHSEELHQDFLDAGFYRCYALRATAATSLTPRRSCA